MSKSLPAKGNDSKNASMLFIVIVFVSLLFSVAAFGVMALGVDFNDFWVNIIATAIKYMLYLGVFFLFVGINSLGEGKWKHELLMEKKLKPLGILISATMAIVAIAGFILLTTVVMQLFMSMGFAPSGAMKIEGWWQYIACVIVVALLPAVIEELLFRGLILRGVKGYGTVRAVVISAVLFMLFHLNPAQTVFQLVLGVILACVVLLTGNLFYGMILHFANNFAIVTYTFITGDPSFTVGFSFGWVLAVVLSTVFGVLLLYGLMKAVKKDFVFEKPKKKVFSAENSDLFFAVGLALFVWIGTFIGM